MVPLGLCSNMVIGQMLLVYGRIWFHRISIEVGVGSSFKFWHDSWCGIQLLKASFVRIMQDWELESIVSFINII